MCVTAMRRYAAATLYGAAVGRVGAPGFCNSNYNDTRSRTGVWVRWASTAAAGSTGSSSKTSTTVSTPAPARAHPKKKARVSRKEVNAGGKRSAGDADAELAGMLGKLRWLKQTPGPDAAKLSKALSILKRTPRRISVREELKIVEAVLHLFSHLDPELSRGPAAALVNHVKAREGMWLTKPMKHSLMLLTATPEGAMLWYGRIPTPDKHSKRLLLTALARLQDTDAVEQIYASFSAEERRDCAVAYAEVFTAATPCSVVREFWVSLVGGPGTGTDGGGEGAPQVKDSTFDPSFIALQLAQTLTAHHAATPSDAPVLLLRSIVGDVVRIGKQLSLHPARTADLRKTLKHLEQTAGTPQPPKAAAA